MLQLNEVKRSLEINKMELGAIEILQNETFDGEFYNKLMDKDNIAEDWLLVGTPLPLVILLCYLVVVWRGPRWMQHLPSYQLTHVLRVYNLLQIFINLYLLFSLVKNPRAVSYIIKTSCSADSVMDEEAASLRYAYLYYTWGFEASKIIDLLDTVFMILRKRNSHITFLHVYHHTAMVFFTWFTLRYVKAVQASLPGLINVSVHVVMYTYYFLSTFGPQMEKYLWWKKHLTKLQLTQFGIIFVYIFVLYMLDCPISRAFTYIWLFNVVLFIFLFADFYIRAYICQPNTDEIKQSKKE